MVPPGDVKALEHALIALCSDRSACREFQKAARERIETEFSLAVNTKRILENLQEHALWTA
jgi:glycosyltransferase involved in cell wall biosynthesis